MTPLSTPNTLHRVQCLSAAEIFCDLSVDEIHTLSRRAPIRRIEQKTLIYSPAHTTEMLFMLNEGRVMLYQLSTEGKMVTNAVLEAGSLFGEMALLGQSLNGHYAEAVTDCVVCAMTVIDVQQLLLSDVRISNRLVSLLGRRLLDTQQQLSVVTLKHVPNRVAWALLHLMGDADGYDLQVTHEILASIVAANRETVTKILNEFQAMGFITLGRGRISLIDTEKLRQIAEI